MPGLVDIVLPSGEAATVPEADLSQALAAGASRPAPDKGPDDGGLLGAAAAGVFGAGSTATFGLSDIALSEGSYILGGKQLQKEVLSNVKQAREANPYSTMAGEAAGLFVNPTLAGIGEGVEGAVARRAGEGLLGSALSMGARGAAEGAAIGAQRQITEDTLGDHEYNGEALFAAAGKDALLGAGAGAVLGVAGYGVKKALGSLVSSARGPAPTSVLDDIAGVEGSGAKLAEEARAAEKTVEQLRKTGLTGEQAVEIADEIGAVAKQKAAAGPVSSAFDDAVEQYAAAQAAANPERADVIRQAFKSSTKKLSEVEGQIENHALKMSEKGTKVLRNLEDVVNEVQFTEKSEQFAKLVDPARIGQQRDMAASMLQEMDRTLGFWESTASKGGAEGAVKALRRKWLDASEALARVGAGGDASSQFRNRARSFFTGENESAARDLYVKLDRLKRGVDEKLQWGKEGRFGLPEAITDSETGLEVLANKIRSGLEDEATWGRAGPAQARWNGSFNAAKARRDHFMSELGVKIDQQGGVRIPEVDFAKMRNLLNSLKGGETDAALQGVKSTEAVVAGFRDRVAAIREFGELSPKQAAKLEQGLRDLDEFESAFTSARKDAASANRLKEAVLEEREANSIGGIIGLVGDAITKPLTTMQRLARVTQTVQRTEEAINGGLRKFFGGDADVAISKISEKLKPRPKAKIAEEIGEIRSLRGNPMAMQERASQLAGDLGTYAPKTSREVELTAIRALDYLAREAPQPSVPIGILGVHGVKERYSDQQISDWEAKRRAALEPQTVIQDLRRGKLNREAIQAVEFVSPKLFAKMQELAQEQITKLASEGKLDKMPYQQRAVIATLLKVPPDGTWRPDFIAMMQAAKTTPVAESAPQGPQQPNSGVSKRAVKINSDVFATESAAIEQGGT